MKNYLGSRAVAPCLFMAFLLAGCAGSSSNSATPTTPTTPQATAPTVSAIAPAAVPAGAAATTLTVTGTGFTAATVVQVNGTAEITTYVSATQVTAVIPAGQLATGALLQVAALNGTAASTPVNLEVDNPSPAISQVSPASVVIGSGPMTVAVTGTGFLPSTVIQAGASRVTTYVSATMVNVALTAADFASATPLALIAVNPTPGGGSSTSASLAVTNPAPAITQLAPASITAGSAATTITLTGSGFLSSTVLRVNGVARSTTYVNATQITASLPAADLASTATLAITAFAPTPGGGSSNVLNLTVTNPVPAITQLAPATITAGSAATTINITGTGFIPTSAVQVNGSPRTTTYVSATQLTAALTATDLTTGATLSLVVANASPGGGTSPVTSLAVTNPAPTITQLTPATLIAGSPATVVSVTGTGFVPSTTVSVAGATRSTAYISPTQLNVTLTVADLAAAGSLSLTTTSPAPGGGTSAAASVAVNIGAPTILSFTPTTLITSSATPTTVTVTGTNFNSGSYVLLLGVARATTVLSSTQLTFVATVADQASGATLRVTVINPVAGGTNLTGSANLAVSGPTTTPVITSALPTTFFVGSSTSSFTVSGTGITTSSTVQWNGATLLGSYGFYYSGSTIAGITVQVPANLLTAVGTATVTVTTPTASPAVSNSLTVTIANPPAPTITGLSTGYGTINAPATIILYGTGFTSTSTAAFNGQSVPVTYGSSTSLTINVPASAITLPGLYAISVTTPAPGGGTSASTPFTAYVPIANNSMIYNPANGLVYVSVPSSAGAPYGNSIVSVDPASGALGTPIFVGSEPNKLALTSDGKFLWVGLDGASAVRKVDLTANTAGLQFPLSVTASNSFGAPSALALAALPGATDSVVVSSSASTYYNIAVTIYDSGVARANPSSTTTYYNSIYALGVDGARGEIYAGAGSTFYVFTYSSNGVTLKTTASANSGSYASSTPADEFQIANGILYTDSGKAFDPEAGTLKGTFYVTGSTVATGTTTVDTTLGKVFTLDNSTGGYYSANQVQIFNSGDYTQNAVLPLQVPNSNASGSLTPSRLTRWGTNGLVFRESIGVFSLRSNLVKDLSTTLANLNVTLASSGSTATGGTTTYTASVTNTGPSAATNVTLTAMPPSTGIVVSATPSVGTCSVSATISCDLGGLALNASTTVTFIVTQTTSGNAVFTAQVSASETDSSPSDNQASLTLAITGSAYSPQPVIRSVSPSSVVAGSTDTLVTVAGSNFTSSSVIQVSGVAVSTNVVSSTQLTATIPASQLTTLGWLPVSVSTAAPGGGLSASLPLSIYSVVNLSANHMLFDPYTRKIMASVASTSTSVTGNSLVALTPETGTVGTPVSIGSQPSNLGLTDDGQILYVSLLGSNSVARFNMLTQQPDFTVAITSPNTYTTYVPADIAALPGTENTIALNLNSYYGPALYDFNTTTKTAAARTTNASTYNATCPRFADATHLLTLGSYGLTSYPVTASGFGTSTSSTLLNFGGCFQINNSKAFSGTGGVANLLTTPFTQAGTFTLGTNSYSAPLTAADPSLQRSFFLTNLSTNYSSPNGVAIYDQNTFLTLSAVPLNISTTESSSVSYTVLDFFRWGQDGLAALTSGGHIYLLRGAAVVPQLLNITTAATLTSSSATTISHGTGNTLLTLTGSNFIPGVAITWNGGYRTTTIIDATHVTVAIPASDLTVTGTASIVATNPGAPASSTLTVTIN